MLLRREHRTAAWTIERLVGMQAQVPKDPYVGLWTRLEGFDPGELARLIERRRAVRIATLRGTIHLHTGRDALALRAVLQPVAERWWRNQFGRRLTPAERKRVAAAGAGSSNRSRGRSRSSEGSSINAGPSSMRSRSG